MRRATLVLLSGACVLGALLSPLVPWRLAAPRVGMVIVAFTSGIALLNFFLSWVRVPLLIALGRPRERIRYVSGAPGVGTLIVPALFLVESSWPLAFWTLVVLAIDTGNVIWFTISVWNDESLFEPEL